MSDRTIWYVKKLVISTHCSRKIKHAYINRADKGALTRDEDPLSHFCVYFAGYDPDSRLVFIGHHKKSGLWLFNGGHIDRGELPYEALLREAGEEWGGHIKLEKTFKPSFLSITEIEKSTGYSCRRHFDIWYFVPLDKSTFRPGKSLLAKEYYVTGWKNIREARALVTDKNTLAALRKIRKLFV